MTITKIEPDWFAVSIEGVSGVIERAARKVNRQYPRVSDYEDLVQDGTIMVATTANLLDAIYGEFEPNLGVLATRLGQDLMDSVKTEDKHMGSRFSYDTLIEGVE